MGARESRPRPAPAPLADSSTSTEPTTFVEPVTTNRSVDAEELIRLMNENSDVVIRYYNANQDFIEKYIIDHFWEEDVDRWLGAIRKRSPGESLKVRKIDFLKSKNESSHNTSPYENTALIVRRAATFDLDVHFGNRAFEAKRDDLTLNFSVALSSSGSNPSHSAGTKLLCPVGDKQGEKKDWYCYILSKDGNKLSVRVNVPVDAIVGRYSVSLDVVSGTADGRERESYTHEDNSVIVLFNPFSEEDTVYMADAAERKEYVMEDEGFMAQGSYWRIGLKSWEYAQFDRGVLDNVLKMIQNDSRHISQPVKSWKKCNDPVYVSRVLSAMVNCNDDRGVLWGRWDGEYDDGKAPGTWYDSGKILKVWSDGGMKPVKYGQCWVFAGVLNTALRAIGIPSRCITNFASAHDTNANVTVDMYYDTDSGDKLDETSDSVWNFHVWNEGWFKRPDLPEGYDGWQVVDATPQEVSEVADTDAGRRQLFQCGPAPVKAIKEGRINLGFDGNFIFGEVNADKVNWLVKNGRVTQASEILKRDVGRNITTKAVNSWQRVDVTNEYKHPEGTTEERIAFNMAYGRGTEDHSTWGIRNPELLIDPKYEVDITVAEETAFIGSKIAAVIKVKNITDKSSNVRVKIVGSSKRHTGTVHAMIKKETKTASLGAGKEIDFPFEIEQSEYMRSIVDHKVVNLRVVASDTDDGNTKVKEWDVQLEVPDCITVNVPRSIPRRTLSKFDVVFENKLPFTLTKGVFHVNFRGNSLDDQRFTVDKPILPGQKYTVKDVQVLPLSNWGRIYGAVQFDCAEVKDLEKSFRIYIN